MECKHEHIRSVGFKLSCLDCGAALPDDYLDKPSAKESEAPQKKRKPKKGGTNHGADSD